MMGAGIKQVWKSVASMGCVLILAVVILWVNSAGAQSSTDKGADTSCCELFGLWVFAPQGAHGSFLPNHRFLWKSRIYLYDCSGPTITFDWEKGEMHEMRRVSANMIEYKDKSGKVFKAVRKSNKVVVNGKTYRACPGK